MAVAHYWASSTFLPSADGSPSGSPEYLALSDLQQAIRGLTISQGQIFIVGACDMLGALQYHYQNFLKIIQRKIAGDIDCECPDDRYEAVAYIGRAGQFFYFAKSKFAGSLLNNPSSLIPSVVHLLPLRMKYTAHRAMDWPKNAKESTDISHELALGAIGGSRFVSREAYDLSKPLHDLAEDRQQRQRQIYKSFYKIFELLSEDGTIEFNMELDHPKIFGECISLMQMLIEGARLRPRG